MNNSPVASLLTDLVVANRILAHEGVVDDFGHVSARDLSDPQRFWLSRSRSPELVVRDDLIRFDLDARPDDLGTRRPYLETILHARVYAARPDVMAVVHHHARPVLAFCCGEGTAPLRPIFHMGALMGAHIPFWDSATEFGDTAMIVDDAPKADGMVRAMGEHHAVLLRGHGATCVGAGLREAVFASIYMAENAALQ
ncbi:MAG: class II aldolase/adducin family protein, partial [Gemmatimonadaceae bacterium]|nr:class II aldolase/adducin family protein [Acetobacteraceae bacterium]